MQFQREWPWLHGVTLTAKLTLWNSIVVLVVAAIALFGLREGLRWMLLKELDSELKAEAYEIGLSIVGSSSETLHDEMRRSCAGHIARGWFVQLIDPSAMKIMWSSENTPSSLREIPAVAREQTQPIEYSGYRLARSDALPSGATSYQIRVGVRLDFIQEDIDNVTKLMVPVLGGVFCLAPLGGYLLAKRATRPLQRIISGSRALHPTRPDNRLPVRKSGDELDQLSAEINRFLDRIAAYLQENRNFIANAAHELRSPLTALMATVDVALNRARSTAEYEEILATVHDECRQLTTLANQLLLLAESDAGLLEASTTPVDLQHVVRSAAEMFQGVAEDKGVRLITHLSVCVKIAGDSTRMRQVVNNLIDNAIKFTPRGGSINVRLQLAENDSRILLTIADTGIGIPAQDQPHVFERFRQVHSGRSQGEQTGFGLGLSICRSIVRAYQGEISLASAPGIGTTMIVSFPRLEPTIP